MWQELRDHHAHVADRRFETLVDADRAADFSAKTGDMLLDYAKTNIDADGRALLIALLEKAEVAKKRDAMFAGEKINFTEDRAVLHTALRNRSNTPILVDGTDVMPDVNDVLEQMAVFCFHSL